MPYLNDIGGPLLKYDLDDGRGDFNLPTFAEKLFEERHYTYNRSDIAATTGRRRVVSLRATFQF